MFKIPVWLLVIIVFNIAVFIIILNPNPNVNLSLFSGNANNNPTANATNVETKNQSIVNQSSNQTANQTTNQTNQTNQTNTSTYKSICEISLTDYIKDMENITGFTTIETKFFNKTDDAISYVRNWSSTSYELIGIGKDIFILNKTNKTIISVNNFTAVNGSFTLPIVCDEKGKLGSYSSCILSNISNMTSSCHYITVSVSECDREKMEHDFWEDINYWITPKPSVLNESQLFNFTITSSRNRLEYASLYVWYKRPPLIDKNVFNQSIVSTKGDRISITTTLNLTGKTFGGLILETYFKKKCYKYDILSQYLY